MSLDPGVALYDFFLLHPEIDRAMCKIDYFPGSVTVWQPGQRTGWMIPLD